MLFRSARRYSLQAACGIAPEDDDANKATASYNERKKPEAKPEVKVEPKPDPKPKETSGRGGEWNIVLKEKEGGDWAQAIMDAVEVALELAKSADDVNAIFKVNKVHFDRLKEETPTIYADALDMLKKAKNSFKE